MVRRIHLAFLTLIPRVKLFLCRCVVTASSKQARSVTPVRITIQHAVIHRLVNSQPEPCVTQVVRLAARVIASLRRERSCAGNPGMIGAICRNFVPVIRQHVQRISLSQTVRSSCFSNPDRISCFYKAKAVGLKIWRAPTVFAPHWTVRFLHVLGIRLFGMLTTVQRNASRQVLHLG